MLRNIWKLLNNSFTGLIIGIALTLIIFYLQKQQIQVGYTLLNTNVIAKGGIDKNITILFKNDTIPNLNLIEFGLWNDGTEYIDKKNISETDPLSIVPDNGVQILDYKIIKKSRANLNLELKKLTDSIDSKIILQIQGDDGLEKSDGIKIQIIYSGNENSIWKVNGRVKGNLNSFKKYSAEELRKYEKKTIGILIFLIALFFGCSLFIIWYFVQVRNKKLETNIASGIFVFTLFGLGIFLSLKGLWDYIFYSGTLDWLLK